MTVVRVLALAAMLLPSTALAFVPFAGAGDALAAPPLVDMRGGAVDTVHGVTILSFFYTRCPDPRMVPTLVTAKFHQLTGLLAGTPIRLIEVTLDPADVPAVLRRYAAATGADGRRWTLATGEPGAVTVFAERMGIVVDRPRPGAIVHSEAVVIARDGVVARNVPGNGWTAPQIAAEARAVATLPADPLGTPRPARVRRARRLRGAVPRARAGVTPAVGVVIFLTLFGGAAWWAHRVFRLVTAPTDRR